MKKIVIAVLAVAVIAGAALKINTDRKNETARKQKAEVAEIHRLHKGTEIKLKSLNLTNSQTISVLKALNRCIYAELNYDVMENGGGKELTVYKRLHDSKGNKHFRLREDFTDDYYIFDITMKKGTAKAKLYQTADGVREEAFEKDELKKEQSGNPDATPSQDEINHLREAAQRGEGPKFK